MAGGDGCADLFLFCERFHVEAILLEQLFERYVVPSLWLVRSTLSLEKDQVFKNRIRLNEFPKLHTKWHVKLWYEDKFCP